MEPRSAWSKQSTMSGMSSSTSPQFERSLRNQTRRATSRAFYGDRTCSATTGTREYSTFTIITTSSSYNSLQSHHAHTSLCWWSSCCRDVEIVAFHKESTALLPYCRRQVTAKPKRRQPTTPSFRNSRNSSEYFNHQRPRGECQLRYVSMILLCTHMPTCSARAPHLSRNRSRPWSNRLLGTHK